MIYTQASSTRHRSMVPSSTICIGWFQHFTTWLTSTMDQQHVTGTWIWKGKLTRWLIYRGFVETIMNIQLVRKKNILFCTIAPWREENTRQPWGQMALLLTCSSSKKSFKMLLYDKNIWPYLYLTTFQNLISISVSWVSGPLGLLSIHPVDSELIIHVLFIHIDANFCFLVVAWSWNMVLGTSVT
jgi:hypothetical protein